MRPGVPDGPDAERPQEDRAPAEGLTIGAHITGAHLIIGTSDAQADRAFLRDVLGLEWVDAGEDWLIFALPPADLAMHPGKNGRHELYLMCDDLDATLTELRRRGATVKPGISEQPWGRLATIVLPGGGDLSIYEPRHAIPRRNASEADTRADREAREPRR